MIYINNRQFPEPFQLKGNDIMIRLEDVHKSFGELEVLKGIDLHVKEGEKLVII